MSSARSRTSQIGRWLAGCLGLLASFPSWAGPLSVPGDHATIQQAIDAAIDGQSIVVAPGRYFETIDLLGKAIIVESSGGPGVTTIDGGGSGSVVVFTSGEGPSTRLSGFSITNGLAPDGGGVRCEAASSPTIVDCIVLGNEATDDGGGVYVIQGSNPTFLGCTIRDNLCGDDGGGLLCAGASPMLVECDIIGNRAEGGSTTPNGGGLHTREGSLAVIARCVIARNHAQQGAGGIRCFGSDAMILDCLLVGNTTDTAGGAIRAYDSEPIITNCTIVGNVAATTGGGIDSEASSASVITNCIVWGNIAPTQAQIGAGSVISATVTYCDVEGGWAGVGNFDLDPRFVDPLGPDGTAASGDEDYHLLGDSPCIDAGSSTAPGLSMVDFDGDDRVLDGDGDGVATPDLGFDELAGGFLRGDVNGDGGFDVSDVVFALAALFIPGSSPVGCDDAADVNDDGLVDVSDAVFALAALFVPGSAPVPSPTPPSCGADPTADLLGCSTPDCP